ncbi:MAG: hypothetical protein Q9215_003194 [Flavoplaca cf. flavocitrina]
MLRILIIALFTLSLPLALASPANPPAIAVDQGFTPQWNAPMLSRGQPYVIPKSDLILVLTPSKRSLIVKDTLLLLMESLFSATERIDAGGRSALDPVELFTHKHGYVQIQVIGYFEKLTPFKLAQVFMGMATVGARAGYYDSNIIVVEHNVGPIAQVHIR